MWWKDIHIITNITAIFCAQFLSSSFCVIFSFCFVMHSKLKLKGLNNNVKLSSRGRQRNCTGHQSCTKLYIVFLAMLFTSLCCTSLHLVQALYKQRALCPIAYCMPVINTHFENEEDWATLS
jgi:hypothetical protein